MNSWLIYLVQVSICHLILYGFYWIVLRKLTFFQLNRIYLLFAVLTGFLIPALEIPFWEPISNNRFPLEFNFRESVASNNLPLSSVENTNWWSLILPIIYFFGALLYLIKLLSSVSKIVKLIIRLKPEKFNGFKKISVTYGPSIFTFFNYLFINDNKLNLSFEQQNQVILHERTHARQMHSIDHLILELCKVIIWFNPAIWWFKSALSHQHEFIADEIALTESQSTYKYSQLILQLASSQNMSPSITHQFSMNNIKKRIIMLNQSKSAKNNLFRYLMAVPVIIGLFITFSCEEKLTESNSSNLPSEAVIANINWTGNTLYSDAYLTEYLGIKSGDDFNEEFINQKLHYNPIQGDLSSLYMDKGYLFFGLETKKEMVGEKVNLTFEIYEGDIINIGEIKIVGNQKIESRDLLALITFKSGDLFNRSELVKSQKNLAETGIFNPKHIDIYPVPDIPNHTVDIEFRVEEL